MNGALSQAVDRIRLFLLAVMCWLCFVPTAHAIRPQTPAELQLKEETPGQEPLAYCPEAGLDAELRNGLFVLNNPLRYTDPSGHGPDDYTGASGRAMLQEDDPEASRVVLSAKQSAGTMAAVMKAGVAITPAGTAMGIGEAVTGKEAYSGEKLTTGQRVKSGVLAGVSIIPAVGLEAKVLKVGEGAAKDIRAFKSFDALKRALGPAGEGMAWHHIVEQSQIGRFGAEAIHNTENVVAVSSEVNQKINAFYSSINKGVTGSESLTVRQWLSTKSYQEARQFGMQTLKKVQAGQTP